MAPAARRQRRGPGVLTHPVPCRAPAPPSRLAEPGAGQLLAPKRSRPLCSKRLYRQGGNASPGAAAWCAPPRCLSALQPAGCRSAGLNRGRLCPAQTWPVSLLKPSLPGHPEPAVDRSAGGQSPALGASLCSPPAPKKAVCPAGPAVGPVSAAAAASHTSQPLSPGCSTSLEAFGDNTVTSPLHTQEGCITCVIPVSRC